MAKRLAGATSPYLLQHAGNPVDWWPWSDAAFEEARRRDVPVLLSVGYAACHWCHVMAHESFEHDQTAALMNENLVCIKVDREERPDVDSVYMTATQAMTGQGGWPMTVFLTADREPFYCGTYFPRDYFTRLIQAISKAWRDDREGVTGQARRVTAALTQASARATAPDAAGLLADLAGAAGGAGGAGPEAAAGDSRIALARLTESAVRELSAGYDAAAGGFGGAPKFPPSTVLEFLLRHAASARRPAAALAMEMVTGTAEAMARGGMYDQLGGGFARYSTDAGWVIPHFEKMLYDNALLARVYAHWWRQSGAALGRRIAEETCDWMIRELGTAEGGLASSLDADSDGTEGAFYVWTPDQLAGVLGADDAEYAAKIFLVADPGTFEGGSSVLQLHADPADQPRYQRVRAALLQARAARVRPATDGKVVAAWNGLGIAALAETGLLLGRPDLVAAARQAAGLLARVHLAGGRLDRTSRDGRSGGTAGVLEDYACVADGFLVLSGVTGEARWLQLAGELLDTALDRFSDQDGRFYDTADDGEQLIYRPADPADGPSPSGTFAVAGALLSYAALTGSARHRAAATTALWALPDIAARYPRAAGWGLAVAEAIAAGPAEIAVVGPPGEERTRALHLAAIRYAPPGAVLAIGDGSSPEPAVPLLAGRGLVDGRPAAYVCRNFACQLPVTEPDRLAALLRA